jgi:hypothetical protein
MKFVFDNRTYMLEDVLEIMRHYIYMKKGIHVQLKLNMNNPKEVELFEKAAAITLDWYENQGEV